MDPIGNPFSPGAGAPPPELAGRQELLDQARHSLLRAKAGRSEQSLMAVGLRGVGKTVLLNRIDQMASDEGYLTVMIEASENRRLNELLVAPLRSILFKLDALKGFSGKVKRGLRVLSSFVKSVKFKYSEVELSMNVDGEPGVADSGQLENDLGELFLAIAEAAKDRSTPVAIIIDEIQVLDEEEMSALVMAMHKVAQRQLPLILIGAGLPQLLASAGRAKSYAERLFRYPSVGPLNAKDAKDAIRQPAENQGVSFTEEALSEIAAVTQGYPYYLQEWGYAAWNLAEQSPIDLKVVQAASKIAIAKLDESFFKVRSDRLTPRERDYLRALAQLGPGPQTSGDIARCYGAKPSAVAPLRAGLIKKGMLFSPAHGYTEFTVPLFTEFMRRVMPDWQARPAR
jgi:type II secretory pathway predicted ATPase ExeA/DNA-binding CsgD family transcriptional regulator